MNDKQLGKKIARATKWSSLTEIISKLITPITNMVLARILAPDAFGVIATITMIISFTEMFTDGGFQKYLIQKEFKNLKEKIENANVAFWTNFTLSLAIWILIALNKEQIATMVGNPGLGFVIVIACIQLPLTSFSSIQMSLYRRSFDFKTLFIVRTIGSLIPFLVTIPLALYGLDYWSLIIGMITMHIFNATFLTVKSEWKPSFFYSIKILKEMFSFSGWSLLESVSIWLCIWIDTFIISYFLNQYYLGIYKTSTIMVNSLLALITAAVIPVLFAALSRLQNNHDKFINLFYKFQKIISILVLPIGVGVLLYKDLATQLILGDQWSDASGVIGIWALTRSILIVFGYLSSEVYRAKGKPKLSFYAQLMHLLVLVPTCIVAVKFSFWALVYARSLVVLQLVLVHFIFMKLFIGIPVFKTITNVLPSIVAVSLMGGIGYYLNSLNENLIWSLFVIILCIVFYLLILLLFPKTKAEIIYLTKRYYREYF